MTTDEWRKRQMQWKRFQQWEAAARPGAALSPSERLAEIGTLVDLALKAAHGEFPNPELGATIKGIGIMRKRLAVIG